MSVLLVILGDCACPLLQWVMKPYTENGKLSQQQSTFNYRLSRARIVTESAFGRLKGHWRCLMKKNNTDFDQMPTLITACVVLHNICEVYGDHIDTDWLSTDEDLLTEHPDDVKCKDQYSCRCNTHCLCYLLLWKLLTCFTY